MTLTNFTNGITSFGTPVLGGSRGVMTTGNVFFVDSGNANSSDGNAADTPTYPASTIDGAIGKCTANNGDVIFVLAGHSENITTAGAIEMDVAGVSVVGLGQGFTRPQVVHTVAAGSVLFSASNCRWSNIIHVAAVASVVNAIEVAEASGGDVANTEIDHCRFTFSATGLEFLAMILLGDGATDSADFSYIHDNWFEAENVAGCNQAILCDDSDFVRVINNLVTGDFTEAAIDFENSASVATEVMIAGNLIWNVDDGTSSAATCISCDATATGIIIANHCAHNQAGPENAIVAADCGKAQNFSTDDTKTVSAALVPEATAT